MLIIIIIFIQDHFTPLQYAYYGGHEEVIQILLSANAIHFSDTAEVSQHKMLQQLIKYSESVRNPKTVFVLLNSIRCFIKYTNIMSACY